MVVLIEPDAPCPLTPLPEGIAMLRVTGLIAIMLGLSIVGGSTSSLAVFWLVPESLRDEHAPGQAAVAIMAGAFMGVLGTLCYQMTRERSK